ncbi:MAG: oligosaccharide flippase family protein [Bacteroidota bacterium]
MARVELAKSSLTGVAQFIVSGLLVIVTIPLFIRYLGEEAYGLFSLVALIGSVNTFANLGLNSALIRFLAEQGKTVESDHDIIVNLVILLTIVCPLAVLGLIFRNAILIHVLNVPVHLLHDAQWLFVAMLASNVLVLLGQTFTAIMDSQQKIYLTNLFQMIYNVAYWGLILLALILGYAIQGVAVGTFAATVLWFSIVSITALRFWGRLTFAGLALNGARSARKQLAYGLQIYAGGIVGLFHEPLTKILLSRFVGIAEVGIFDIGMRARGQVVGLMMKLLSPLYPAISQLKDREKVRFLVHDIEQKTFMIITPIAAMVILATQPVAQLMFHSNVDAISVTAASLVVAYLLGSTTVLPLYLFLLSKGHASRTIVIQVLNVLVNAAVFLVLIGWLGYYAVVVSGVAAILSSFALSVYYQKKFLDSYIFDSLRQASFVLLAFVLALGAGYFMSGMFESVVWKLIIPPLLVAGVTGFLYRSFSLVTSADIVRYLGDRGWLSRISTRFLCTENSGR